MNLPFRRDNKGAHQRAFPQLSLDDWMNQSYGFANLGNGMGWPLLQYSSAGINPEKEPPTDQTGYIDFMRQVYRTNGVVFACMLARMMHFSEARLMFQDTQNGRPGNLFWDDALEVVESPWPNGGTGDLLARAILDVDLAGNSYTAYRNGRFYRLRADWVTIILGSNSDPDRPAWSWDVEVLGYYYCPPQSPEQEEAFLVNEVAHWAPYPDPYASFRGTTWASAAMREIVSDNAMSTHQRKYFEQGATTNFVVSFDPSVSETHYKRWVAALRGEVEGIQNAYKVIWLGGGAQPHVVGKGLEDFRTVRGHGETRIAADAGVPPILVGLSEGLQAATYSNYTQARRHFGDTTCRWLWRTYAQSLNKIVQPLRTTQRSRLWYDLRDVAFMRQDEADQATISQAEAMTIRNLVDGGWIPESVVEAVIARDWTLLRHSGLLSVQLQPPGTTFKPSKQAPQLPPASGAGAQVIIPTQPQMDEITRHARALIENGDWRSNGSHTRA